MWLWLGRHNCASALTAMSPTGTKIGGKTNKTIDTKIVLLVVILALCAFIGGILVAIGGFEDTGDNGGLTPPPLPEDTKLVDDESGGSGISDIFGDPTGVSPPPIPSF
jgi:hypothetical protein